jgi:DNA mismatch endonuclease (patch repair protein)
MADTFTKSRRSEIMARIASKDTQPKQRVRRFLHRLGLRFRLHVADLPGKPDIVLPKWGTVVFVHGCIWHGHDCKRGSAKRRPKSNLGYWNPKIEGNMNRDADHLAAIRKLGWRAVVIWDCKTSNLKELARRLRSLFSDWPRQCGRVARGRSRAARSERGD